MPGDCLPLLRDRHFLAPRGRCSRFISLALFALLMVGTPSFAFAADTKIDPTVLKKVKAATVHIKVQFADGDVSEGSGFLTRARGLVVTNAHVVGMLDNDSRKPSKVEVTFNGGEANSQTVEAKVGFVDGESDLALLAYPTKNLKVVPDLLPIGYSAQLSETQDVFIVGFPLGRRAGLNVSITATTVTSLRKEGGNIKRVQVSGGMHPGNSGGPLVDKDGKVVGVAVSGFTGTQVHLAIPTESLNAVLNGKIANSAFDVAYRDGDKIRVPVHFEKADPLNIMKTIAIETWTGKPGPTRINGSKEPTPLPDDSPIVTLDLKPNEKGAYVGELVLDGKKDPKLSYWMRYRVGRGENRTIWYPSVAINARVGTPVDRKPATLKYDPPLKKSDILTFNSDASFRIRYPDGDDQILGMVLRGSLREVMTDKTDEGKWRKRVTYAGLDATASLDKKPIEGSQQLTKALKDATRLASEIDVDKDGTVLRNLADFSKVPPASRGVLTLVSDQVQQSLDSLSVPLPLKEVTPMTTWKGKQSYELGALGLAVLANAEVTYKYEGVFTRNGQSIAVISFHGPLQPAVRQKAKKGVKPPTLTGQVEGKMEIFTDTGLVFFASERVRAELSLDLEGKSAKAIGILNVQMLRNPTVKKK